MQNCNSNVAKKQRHIHPNNYNVPVAQTVEHGANNAKVMGSDEMYTLNAV